MVAGMNTDRIASLLAIVAARFAELKATQEIVLKTQAHYLAALTGEDWKPLFEDLRDQAREAADQYRKQVLAEMALLSGHPPPGDDPSDPGSPSTPSRG